MEFIWIASSGRKHLLDHSPITGNGLSITTSSTVRLLGAHLVETMCFETHVSKIVCACFFQLRQLKVIRDCLSVDAAKTLVNAFVASHLDYCNGYWLVHLTNSSIDFKPA